MIRIDKINASRMFAALIELRPLIGIQHYERDKRRFISTTLRAWY